MAIYDTKINMIVEKLGRYFNVVSKEEFMAFLAFGSEEAIDSFGNVNFDPTPEMQKLARLVSDTTEGGGTVIDVYDSIRDVVAGTPAGERAALELQAFTTYQILGEPETLNNDWASTVAGQLVRSPFSVQYLCDIDPDTAGSVNSTFAEPNKYSPNLTSLMIRPVKMTPAARESGAVGLFMNCIPTLEFSRCQPVLQITLISPFSALSSDNRIQNMGQMQFLMGQAQLDPVNPGDTWAAENVNAMLAEAVDESALGDYFERISAEIAAMRADPDNSGLSDEEIRAMVVKDIGGIATSGMEMFTSPQTLAPWDELYDEFDAVQEIDVIDPDTGMPTGESTTVGGTRGAPIIDRARPFMTIEDFAVTVTPSKGMMSHKSAELSLLLHDRSRLSEIAEFVKPDLYGRSELMIEYGWSHPQDTAFATDTDIGGNFYGSFLNSLKCKEKYMIVNSSFSFDEVGQVKVKLKLAMKGSQQINTNDISKGEGVDSLLETIKSLTEAIKKLKQELAREASDAGGDAADITGATHFSAASSSNSAMSVDEETSKAIASYIDNNRNSDNENVSEMTDKLTELFGTDGTYGLVSEVRASIDAAVAAKISRMKQVVNAGHDPYPRAFSGAGGSTTYVDIPFSGSTRKKFVSLGYLMLYFVGKPLAATRRFDEVQFIYYSYNDKASYLKDANIAETPIKIEDFEKKFKEVTEFGANIPLGRFLSMVGKEFIHQQSAPVYGLTALYETDEEGNTKLKEAMSEDATQLNNEKKKRLEDAYGSGEDIVFKMPRVAFQLETVPVKVGSSLPSGASGTVLRIHVYDKTATSYSALGKLMEGARNDSLGLITSAASQASREASEPESENDEYNVNSEHATEFVRHLQSAIEGGLIEAVPELMGVTVDGAGGVTIDPEEFGQNYFRIKGGFDNLKKFVAKTMPSIIYGSNQSAVISADLSSMNNSKLATVNMLRGGMGGGSTAQGARDSGVPLQTAPTSLSLTTWGCPIVNYGQNFFVDFGTGTTADNQYVVTGIDHSINSGKFETKIKLAQVDAFGKFSSMFQSIQGALVAISSAGDED